MYILYVFSDGFGFGFGGKSTAAASFPFLPTSLCFGFAFALDFFHQLFLGFSTGEFGLSWLLVANAVYGRRRLCFYFIIIFFFAPCFLFCSYFSACVVWPHPKPPSTIPIADRSGPWVFGSLVLAIWLLGIGLNLVTWLLRWAT